MRSHLTRHVFRHLLSNEPIPHCSCVLRVGPSTLALRRPLARVQSPCLIPSVTAAQRRSIGGGFVSFFRAMRDRNASDTELQGDMAPGCAELRDFLRMHQAGARLPAEPVMVEAWEAFCKHRIETSSARSAKLPPIQPEQAAQLDLVLEYLASKRDAQGQPYLPTTALSDMLQVLSAPTKETRLDLVGLAKAVYNEMLKRKETESLDQSILNTNFRRVIVAIAQGGNIAEARKACEKFGEEPPGQASMKVLNICLTRRDGPEIERTLQTMQARKFPPDMKTSKRLCEYYASTGQLHEAKRWYEISKELSSGPLGQVTYVAMLRACLLAKDFTWGQELVNSIIQEHPTSGHIWNPVLLWALGNQKGIDELDRVVKVMQRRTEYKLNVETINSLLAFAIEEKDPYLAERIFLWGRKRQVIPDATTFVMQIEYRLLAGDVDGARSAFDALVEEDDVADIEVVPAINKLIQSMCRSRQYTYETIVEVVKYLAQRRGRFFPQTVAELVEIHLQREEYQEVIQLVQNNVYHFSIKEQHLVREVFVAFCLNRNNTIAEVWDCYQILVHIFEDLPHDIRTRLMKEFFDRRRPDMAAHAFKHMRDSILPEVQVKTDTYVEAFIGCANTADLEVLHNIHNQLKIDQNIQPSTRLLNALMMAYAACDRAGYALGVWRDILNSNEGPSFESLHIAFRACERHPFGSEPATEIWRMITTMDIEVNRDLLASYVGALAGVHEFDKVTALIREEAEETYGITPDVVM
jgi:hypothetical protein